MSDVDPPFQDPSVQAVFEAYPPAVRSGLEQIRALIFATAEDLDGVGPLEEALRWGEPSYLTSVSGSGTTIRLASKHPESGSGALYVHCQTDLVARFKARHGETFRYEGSRAVHLDLTGELPEEALADCIAMALTYKFRRRAGRTPA